MRSLRRSQHVFGRSYFGRVCSRVVVVTRDKTEERERGREGEKEQHRACDYRKSSVRRLLFPFLRCLELQSVPRPLPLHGWRPRRKKGVVMSRSRRDLLASIFLPFLAADPLEILKH
ncbi:hypothetical protein OPV22_022767 [Ensete ventricosum]|uniref:Uncharacterized protein n=1 Tax=Ensete ventricosum TaxID=4639 RepID=A0AAV8QLZ6_ENSVE|nr:hypothetical protein OPV22_022767 [Ensete ventricosum]